jgi:hypothetical protein
MAFLVDQYTINTLMEFILILIYFILFNYIIGRLLCKYGGIRYNFKKIILSFIIAILIIFVVRDKLLMPYQDANITLTVLEEKNVSSRGNEVWITGVQYDKRLLDLSRYSYPEGWEYRDGAALSYSINSSITLRIPASRNVTIELLMHEWSGKVKIQDGDKVEIVDLYSKKGSNYEYVVKSNKINKLSVIYFAKYASLFAFLTSATYILIELIYKRDRFKRDKL